jgi:hypothetical protein
MLESKPEPFSRRCSAIAVDAKKNHSGPHDNGQRAELVQREYHLYRQCRARKRSKQPSQPTSPGKLHARDQDHLA